MKSKSPQFRNKAVKVDFSETEYEQFKKLKEQTVEKSVASYLRKLALQKPVIVNYRNASADDFLQEMAELKRMLKGILADYHKASMQLQLLDQIPDFRSWLQTHYSTEKFLVSSVNEIHLMINKIYEQWLQK